ncbi:sensor histidine kinase [Streptacidiphilus carbonis]|uniref:sensor histidine kinase n=1 Tax=Streptacidiphilus carbonis TaxID=105422 RepID=UPI000694B6A1|nr:histidine kinase [Streptacidiphilus carbonis]
MSNRNPLGAVPALWRRLPRRVRLAVVTLCLVGAATADALLNFPPPRDWTFTASIVAAASLLFWRRYPRLVLLVILPGLYAGTAVVAAMAALYSVARTRRPHWEVYLGAGLVGLGLFVPWPLHQFVVETFSDHTQDLIYAVMLAAGPAALGLLARTREALSDRVAELATLRDQERELHAETVLARERARIAREMHDVVSHQAGLIAVQAGALQVTAHDPEVRATAGTLRGLAVATLEELRSMILVLRAAGAGPTELAPQPRLSDLARLVADSEVDAELRLPVPAPPALPEPVERAAYRTVQEALTNVRKHAPGAFTEVELSCVAPGGDGQAAERLLVSVVNGPPALVRDGTDLSDLPRGGHGLIGLRERATLLGGTFSCGGTSDGGFAVRLSLPIVGQGEEGRGS